MPSPKLKTNISRYLALILVAGTFLLNTQTANAFSTEVLVNFFKKTKQFFSKTSEEIEILAKKELSNSGELTPLKSELSKSQDQNLFPKQNSLAEASTRDTEWWTTYSGLQTAKQVTICINNKMKADPKIKNKDAELFCKTAFLHCVNENKNNLGFPDQKCIALVNNTSTEVKFLK